MSLLASIVTQVAQSALQGQSQNQSQINQNQGGLGSILGSVLGGAQQQSNANSGLGGILGSVLGGGATQNNSIQGNVLGQVLGSVLGGQQQGGMNKNMLMAALLPLALTWIQQNGGLTGALNKINNMGFGQQAKSWMSTDQSNQGLDANDITKLFDSQDIQAVSAQTGCSSNEVCQGMANLLPQIFDNLTPNGNTNTEAEANKEINQILSQISSLTR